MKTTLFLSERQSPPYFALAVSSLDFFSGGLSVICFNTYGYTLVPSYLAGTIASMIAIMQFMLGTILRETPTR